MAKRKKNLKKNYPLIVSALVLLVSLLVLVAIINYHPSAKQETPSQAETPAPQPEPQVQSPSQTAPEPVVPEPAVRKGCLSKEIFEGRVKDGIVHFKDYYGFEKGKTYQYRALVRVDENWDVIDLPLCEVTPTKDSFAKPSFKDDVKPEFAWNAETQTLTVANSPALDVSAALLAEWGCGDKYEWAVSSGYLGEKDGGFWPWFLLKAGDTWNELHTTFNVEDWNNLGDVYSMTANEYYLEIYIPGEGIGQCIPLLTDDLGTAKTLTRP